MAYFGVSGQVFHQRIYNREHCTGLMEDRMPNCNGLCKFNYDTIASFGHDMQREAWEYVTLPNISKTLPIPYSR